MRRREGFAGSAVTMQAMSGSRDTAPRSRARPRRDRRRARRALRGHRAPHPRAEGARALRAARLHDLAARASPAIPSGLLAGARGASSRPRSATTLPEPERPPGHGRLPRYAWHDAYAALREKLDALGRELGGALPGARRREPARRPRGGGPLRGRLLRQEHDADHAPPRLVGRPRDARHRRWSSSRPRRWPTGCGSCTRCIDACPTARSTSRACSTRPAASPTGRRCPSRSRSRTARRSARRSTAATSARTSAPGTAGVERRRAGLPPDAAAHVDLLGWLAAEERSTSRPARAALRPAQRSALAAAERARRARQHGRRRIRRRSRRSVAHAEGDDALLAEHARWALERLEATMQLRGVERWISLVRLIAFPFVVVAGRARRALSRPAGRSGRGSRPAVFAAGVARVLLLARTRARRAGTRSPRASRPRSSTRRSSPAT